MLIVVEPGSPKGFRYIHSIREQFIKKSREEACIIAPCPHHATCPKASMNKTWCHFSQFVPKYPRNVLPKIPHESSMDNEKFSYLVLKKGKTPNVLLENQSKATTIVEKSFFWPRLILPAIKKHQHVILDLCNITGTIERRTIGKSHRSEGGYGRARRIHWGDLWPYPLRTPNRFRKESKRGGKFW